MSKDNTMDTAPEIEDDLNTTAPQSKPAPWSMPEPVYRQTSGKLPQGYAKSVDSEMSSDEIISVPPNNSSDSDPVPASRPFNPTLKIILVVLGLVGMIAFLVVFLTVIYFFLLR